MFFERPQRRLDWVRQAARRRFFDRRSAMPDVNPVPQQQSDTPTVVHDDSVEAQGSTMSPSSPVQQSIPTKSPTHAPSTLETMSYAAAAPKKRSRAAPESIGRYRVIKEVGSGS